MRIIINYQRRVKSKPLSAAYVVLLLKSISNSNKYAVLETSHLPTATIEFTMPRKFVLHRIMLIWVS
jgi:hypothetical protein